MAAIDYEKLAAELAEKLQDQWFHIDSERVRERGITRRTLEGWKGRYWRDAEGLVYNVVGKQLMINLTELDKWLTNYCPEESTQARTARDSALKSSKGASSSLTRLGPATPNRGYSLLK